MKSLKLIIIILPLLIALLVTTSTAQPPENDDGDENTITNIESMKGSSSLSSRFLNSTMKHQNEFYNSNNKRYRLRGRGRSSGGNRRRGRVTCRWFPRICRVRGSPGPDCCRNKCVNVRKDRLNCGMCGRRCRFPEICCNGRCVNPWYDRRNCGGCRNRCKRGSFCYYGMCSYA